MPKRAINLSKLEVVELVQLRDEIETALNGKIVIERDELQTRMDALTALVGKASNGDGRVACATSRSWAPLTALLSAELEVAVPS